MTPGRGALAAMPMAKRLRLMRSQWQWYLLIAPAIAYLLVFSYFPMYGVIIAFKNYRVSRGILGSGWVGLQYFKQFITFPQFGLILKNTLCISLYSLATFPLSCILALMLNELDNQRFKRTVQMVSYAPHFVSTVVVCSIVTLFLDRSNGILNHLIVALGGERNDWLSVPSMFSDIYVWSGVWQNAGWNSIIYIAALAAIDPQLHEAAQIDGASRLQRILHINLPGILPTAIIMFILDVGQVMNMGFEKVFLMQNAQNTETSQVISTFVYEAGLINSDYGFSTAIGLFNNIINIVLLLTVNKIAKKISDTSLF